MIENWNGKCNFLFSKYLTCFLVFLCIARKLYFLIMKANYSSAVYVMPKTVQLIFKKYLTFGCKTSWWFACNFLVWIKALKFKKFSLLGWSDGGITALIAAAKYPNLIHKLVVWGANASVTQEDVRIYNGMYELHVVFWINYFNFYLNPRILVMQQLSGDRAEDVTSLKRQDTKFTTLLGIGID